MLNLMISSKMESSQQLKLVWDHVGSLDFLHVLLSMVGDILALVNSRYYVALCNIMNFSRNYIINLQFHGFLFFLKS